MTNRPTLLISQQLPAELIDQRLYTESLPISQPRSNVRFGATDAVCVFEKQPNPSLAWYSKPELMRMRRDCATLSRHYGILSQRHTDAELLGLEDARVAKEQRSKRKLHIQNILRQQDIHRQHTSIPIQWELQISQLLTPSTPDRKAFHLAPEASYADNIMIPLPFPSCARSFR